MAVLSSTNVNRLTAELGDVRSVRSEGVEVCLPGLINSVNTAEGGRCRSRFVLISSRE